MPTYQYKCNACLHEFEEFQSMSDDPLVKCPSCNKRKLVRVISGAGLVFRGSGFYLTDYKKRGTASDGTGDSKPTPPAESSAPADGKAAAKGEGGTGASSPGGGEKKEKPKKPPTRNTPSGGTT